MSEFPLAGWAGEYPGYDPKYYIELVCQDLRELKAEKELSSSEAWLSKFAKNTDCLIREIEHLYVARKVACQLHEIRNWLHNAEEGNVTLEDILAEAKEMKYKNLKSVESFCKKLAEDHAALKVFINHLESYLAA